MTTGLVLSPTSFLGWLLINVTMFWLDAFGLCVWGGGGLVPSGREWDKRKAGSSPAQLPHNPSTTASQQTLPRTFQNQAFVRRLP